MGVSRSPMRAADAEQLDDRPALPDHAMAAIPQVGAAAMEEDLAAHGSPGQPHPLGHSPHELLI